jgi:Domain of unknown function (DUF5063)
LPHDDTDQPKRMTNEEWLNFFERLGRHLESFDAYSFVFDPYDLEAEPVTGLLGDDLANLYRDLGEALDLTTPARPTWTAKAPSRWHSPTTTSRP